MMPPLDATDALCIALLRGDAPVWPFAATDAAFAQFIERVSFHGVESLLHERLQRMPGSGWPVAVRTTLQRLATQRAVWELRNRQQMSAALAALAEAGVEALVYKGTALAYTLYANPVWRPRGDTDLLVAPAALDAAVAVLVALGYRQYTGADEAIYYKLYFSLRAPEGGEHGIDLHWRLNNSELLSGVFGFDELRARALALPALGPTALTISDVDALAIACLHRGVHKLSAYTVNDKTYYSGDRLIWLQDIDLLARRLRPTGLEALYALARQKGLAAICSESLALAAGLLHTPLPPGWQAQLSGTAQGKADRYLQAGPFGRTWTDLCACPGLAAKAAYCRRLLFPPAAYMDNKYAAATWRWLPWLYLRRIVAGLAQRFRLGRESR